VAVALALAAAAGLATAWDRDVGRGWRWVLRATTALLCTVTALLVAGIWVNRQMNLFPTWSEVSGRIPEAPPPGQLRVDGVSTAGSQIVTFNVPGPASGISLPAKAYLPPGYDSAAGRRTRYPVVEALAGFPGTPSVWLLGLAAQKSLDAEILAGRMAPTVVVFPRQNFDQIHDSECVDAVAGPRFDTYLTEDVYATVTKLLRVRTDRTAWAVIGTSTGGFCATNLALRHPQRWAAVASLSGYYVAVIDTTTGDLYRGDQRLRDQNSPLWRVKNLPLPSLALFLCVAGDDRPGYREMQQFITALQPPVTVTRMVVAQGGHTGAVWRSALPTVWDWLSGWLAAPQAEPPPGS
jgi:enterochelin esterase-like enzyme